MADRTQYQREYYAKHRDKLRAYHRQRRQANKTQYRTIDKTYYEKRHSTPEGQLAAYRRGARRRNKDFSLSKRQFMFYWKKPCYYCGDPIITVGLDRVDNSKGYVPGNIVPCCEQCNFMKSTLTQGEFVDRCKKITLKAANL